VGTIEDSASLRVSAGVGIIWKSPFGPIGIDVALPVLKEDFDLTQLINFSVGTTF
jgi:outer membrane protein insertion porin family